LHKGAHVLGPCALVEVHGEEPASLVIEELVDTHHVPAGQMSDHRCIVEGDEGLVRAFAALHLRELTDAFDELVPARRRVARLPGFLAHEPRRKDVLAPAEQRPKQPHLLGLRLRDRASAVTGRRTWVWDSLPSDAT